MSVGCDLDQDFYEDLFEELSKYGDIENLNICDNIADHMVIFLLVVALEDARVSIQVSFVVFVFFRVSLFVQVGNVYVQFREEEHAANAVQNLTGRFYAGLIRLLPSFCFD